MLPETVITMLLRRSALLPCRLTTLESSCWHDRVHCAPPAIEFYAQTAQHLQPGLGLCDVRHGMPVQDAKVTSYLATAGEEGESWQGRLGVLADQLSTSLQRLRDPPLSPPSSSSAPLPVSH